VDKFGKWWLIFSFAVATAFGYLPVGTENRPFWHGFLCYGISLSGVFYFSVGVYLKRFHISFRSTTIAIIGGIYGIGCLLARTYAHSRGGSLPIGIDCLILPALMYSTWHFTSSRKLPSWFTSCSFSIFLLHCIFLGYAGIALKRCTFDEQTNSFIACLFAIIAPLILTNLLHKFAPKVANFLFAGRS